MGLEGGASKVSAPTAFVPVMRSVSTLLSESRNPPFRHPVRLTVCNSRTQNGWTWAVAFLLSVRREDAEGRYVNAILTTRMKGGLAQKAVGPSFRPKGKGKESREHKGGNGKVQEVIQGSERRRW